MHPDDNLTADDAAIYLNKSAKTLERWRSQGVGPAYHKVGGTIAYRRADLDSFFRSSRVEPISSGRIERIVRSA